MTMDDSEEMDEVGAFLFALLAVGALFVVGIAISNWLEVENATRDDSREQSRICLAKGGQPLLNGSRILCVRQDALL